jgi:tetratricopeptide (TPR) repeat protein
MPGPSLQLRAAVMLETDLAAARMDDEESVDFHLGLARRLIGLFGLKKDQDSSARDFLRRWYEFASSIYLSLGRLDKASVYVQAALGVSPDNPMLYVYRGAISELRSAVNATDLRGRAPRVASGSVDRQTENAAADYRHALALDAHLAIAHLRLGWVQVRQGDVRARNHLDAALSDASDPETRYLAHLFMGAEAEHDQRLPDAAHEYEAAQRMAPECQTPYIALAHVAGMLGDADGAREAASRLANLEKHEEPWWSYQLVGLSLGSLIWLRAAAHQ